MSGHLPGALRPPTALARLRSDFGATYAANGFIGFMFAASGPTAVILAVGTRGGLSPAELASWIFGVFIINGLLTIGMSWCLRQPLCFFWTIPGTVLVGPALGHLSFPEVVGAFYITAGLILLLGALGVVDRLIRAVPLPIVMGMVAGVFLRFGLDLVRSLHSGFAIAAPMVAVFLALSAWPQLGRRVPSLIGALLAGGVAVAATGRFAGAASAGLVLARPVLQAPTLSLAAVTELVVPLAVTVLVIQNGQGLAVLRAAGHRPPMRLVTVMCGVASAAAAAIGAVSTCLAGPTNALVTSSGEPNRHYVAALCTGVFAVLFGLLAPAVTGLLLGMPPEYVAALGGLAMLRVLQGAFAASFRDRFTLGALVSFLVTVADLPVLNIGAAFWGLAAGVGVSLAMERRDFTDA